MPRDWDDTGVENQFEHSDSLDASKTGQTKHRIMAAAEDVDLILLKLSQNGTDLDETFKDGLLASTNTIKSGSYDEETEKTFWVNYSKLTRLAKPIHIDTLRYNESLIAGNKKTDDPIIRHLKTLKNYRWLAIISFVVMISALAYVSVANSTLESSRSLKNEQLRLLAGLIQETSIEDIMKEVENATRFYGADGLPLPAPPSPKSKPTMEKTLGAAHNKISSEDSKIESPVEVGEDAGTAPPAEAGEDAGTAPPAEAGEDAGTAPPAEAGEDAGTALPVEAVEDADADQIKQIRYDIFATTLNNRRVEIQQLLSNNSSILYLLQLGFLPYIWDTGYNDEALAVNQELILRVVSGYFLPLLASILGVCVFIMRTGTEQIENMSFQVHNTGVYSHRLILGVVGGLAISWFSASDSTGTLQSLTPIALAFLVGYSVEILFNILDGILKALGAKDN